MMNRDRYPPNWDAIAQRIKERAGWHCEHCGHPHDPAHGYTLTVHHLDMNPANCTYENLVVLCQRCHLRIQATYRPGMLVLPGMRPAWMVQRGLGV